MTSDPVEEIRARWATLDSSLTADPFVLAQLVDRDLPWLLAEVLAQRTALALVERRIDDLLKNRGAENV